MNKKELKKHINDNGFFLHLNTKKLTKDEFQSDSFRMEEGRKRKKYKTNAFVPENTDNLLYFSAIASQSYEKGEKNRNGYKYDHSGWKLDAYSQNPALLWQHNDQYPIGGVTDILFTDNGMEIKYFVDTEVVEEKDLKRLERGYVNGISTGAIPYENNIEDNETGEIMSIDDFINKEEVDFCTYIDVIYGTSEEYTMIVKAELVENSLVTIPSNAKALTARDSLQSFYQKNSMKEEDFLAKKESLKDNTPSTDTPVDETIPETPSENEEVPAEVPEEIPAPETTEDKLNLEGVQKMVDSSLSANPAFAELAKTVVNMVGKIDALQKKIDSVPMPKGHMVKAPAGQTNSQSELKKALGL